MARETPRQKRITGRVMHEFMHGEVSNYSSRLPELDRMNGA
jgi:hypothetical protein